MVVDTLSVQKKFQFIKLLKIKAKRMTQRKIVQIKEQQMVHIHQKQVQESIITRILIVMKILKMLIYH